MKRTSIAALLLASGCTYQSAVDVAPAYNTANSYGTKIPGQWGLYVDADEFADEEVKVKGQGCSFHTYPVDLESSFTQSAVGTLKNVIEEVQLVDRPIDQGTMERSGYAGQITLKGEDFDGDLVAIPGFWSNDIEADLELVASITVDGRQGRLYGSTVSGDGEATLGAGNMCSGGVDAISEAGSEALEDIMGRIAESIANSPRLREYTY